MIETIMLLLKNENREYFNKKKILYPFLHNLNIPRTFNFVIQFNNTS